MKDVDGDGFITEQDLGHVYEYTCGRDEALAKESKRASNVEKVRAVGLHMGKERGATQPL